MGVGISRRGFLYDLGRGTLALAVLGLAACSDPGETPDTIATTSTTGESNPPPPASQETTSTQAPTAGALSWHRVNLGCVSA